MNEFTISPSNIPVLMEKDSDKLSELFLRKKGTIPKPKKTEAMRWGNDLESIIVHKMERIIINDYYEGLKTMHLPTDPESGGNFKYKILKQNDHWFYGYADSMLGCYGKENESGVFDKEDQHYILIEAKSTSQDIDLKKDIPVGWWLQCQAMLMMCRAWDQDITFRACYLGCLSNTNKFSIVKVEPEPIIQGEIFKTAKLFKSALEKDDITLFTQSPLTELDLDHLKPEKPKKITATLEIEKIVHHLQDMKRKAKMVKEVIDQDSGVIKKYMQDGTELYSEHGNLLGEYKPNKLGKRNLKIKTL